MPIVVCLLWVVVGSWKVLPHVITGPTGLPHLESTSTSPDLQLFCKFQASVETDLKPPVPVGKEVTGWRDCIPGQTMANSCFLMEVSHEPSEHPPQTQWRRLFWATVLALCVLRTPSGCEKRRPACKMMRGWPIQWAHEIRTWQYESVNHVNRGHLLLCLRSCDCRPVLGATEIHYTMLMDFASTEWPQNGKQSIGQLATTIYNILVSDMEHPFRHFGLMACEWNQASASYGQCGRQRTEPCSTSPHPQGRPTPPATISNAIREAKAC